jgi:Glycosyl hydrolase catalytic core
VGTHSRRDVRLSGLGLAAAALLGALGLAPEAAHGSSAQCPAAAYGLSLQALTGPAGADLTIRVASTTPECLPPERLGEVDVTIYTLRGRVQRTLARTDVAAPGGTATLHIGKAARRQRVAARVVAAPDLVLRGQTRTLLRPDLVLTSVQAPRQVLSGRVFTLAVRVTARAADVATSATVTATAGATVLATVPVSLRPGARANLGLPVTLWTPGATPIHVAVTADVPVEANLADNARDAPVDVTEFQVVPTTVLVPSLAGYGGQFNQNVYAEISRKAGVTDQNVLDMERNMVTLHPEFSRIFFHPAAFADPDRMQSFVRALMLAQRTGTTINVTWQSGRMDVASGNPKRFADLLIDLVRNKGITNLRWLTLQNEPNGTRMTPEQYEAQYRALDPYLMPIRGQVRYMGGDLVAMNQRIWLEYFAAHMTDILDSYSIHVFWDYWDVDKLQDRLAAVRAIVDALPEQARKPLYVTEYGVRGLQNFNGARESIPGVWEDGTPIMQTNVSAFQHAWFDMLSARLGYLGTSKWDLYFGVYDDTPQAHSIVGSPLQGWPLYPVYNFLHLLTTTVKQGWKVVGVDSVPDTTRLLTAYSGPKGAWSVLGLDTTGALLNTPSPTLVPYSIGGLPAGRTFRLLVWNQAGDGLVGPATPITTDAVGVAGIAVPQHAVFVLTTVSL